VAGLVLLVLAGLLGWPERPVTGFGDQAVERLREEPGADRTGPGGWTGGGTGEAPAPAGPAQVPVSPGDPPPAPERLPPVGLRIDAIDLATTVVETGVDPQTGALQVPPPELVGWYRHGPDLSAATGSVVIAGHVDSQTGPGAFWRLHELAEGDAVTVTGPDGGTREYRVVAREVHGKQQLPEGVFAREGAARLTLITCGGPFDAARGDYRDNIVITALPA
jgi:hypothetical protein